ncbi:Peptidase C1A [Parasponia andersonii]|uniref:Peptidase C1A n=1 Tax=Parasponia andersonii TaxID=3476 RepID=A0A2P5AJ87_PARAD|nr:Peptidase C1A [Parasponia andersonii]
MSSNLCPKPNFHYDLRQVCPLGEVLDQGNQATCWAVATAHCGDIMERVARARSGCIVREQDLIYHSPQEIINHYHVRNINGVHNGFYNKEAFGYMLKYGVPSRAVCPYRGVLTREEAAIRHYCSPRYCPFIRFYHFNSRDYIWREVFFWERVIQFTAQGPLVMAFLVGKAFSQWRSWDIYSATDEFKWRKTRARTSNGRAMQCRRERETRSICVINGIYYWTYPKNNVVFHAMVVIGLGEEDGRPYWVVKNSYGPTWGRDGYARISRTPENNQIQLGNISVPKLANHPYADFLSNFATPRLLMGNAVTSQRKRKLDAVPVDSQWKRG